MARSQKQRPLTADWLPIETIKGIPNILSSKVAIITWKNTFIAKGQPVPETRFCWFCGRPLRSWAAVCAHRRWCDRKKVYEEVKRNGWRFNFGNRVVRVRSMRWNFIRSAALVEAELNRRMAEEGLTEEAAVFGFRLFIKGHTASFPAQVHLETSTPVAVGGVDL